MLHLNVRSVVRLLVLSSAGVLATSAALAASPPEQDELQEVIVTGSRLVTGFTTPTPVTILGADLIEDLNITNIGARARWT